MGEINDEVSDVPKAVGGNEVSEATPDRKLRPVKPLPTRRHEDRFVEPHPSNISLADSLLTRITSEKLPSGLEAEDYKPPTFDQEDKLTERAEADVAKMSRENVHQFVTENLPKYFEAIADYRMPLEDIVTTQELLIALAGKIGKEWKIIEELGKHATDIDQKRDLAYQQYTDPAYFDFKKIMLAQGLLHDLIGMENLGVDYGRSPEHAGSHEVFIRHMFDYFALGPDSRQIYEKIFERMRYAEFARFGDEGYLADKHPEPTDRQLLREAIKRAYAYKEHHPLAINDVVGFPPTGGQSERSWEVREIDNQAQTVKIIGREGENDDAPLVTRVVPEKLLFNLDMVREFSSALARDTAEANAAYS